MNNYGNNIMVIIIIIISKICRIMISTIEGKCEVGGEVIS